MLCYKPKISGYVSYTYVSRYISYRDPCIGMRIVSRGGWRFPPLVSRARNHVNPSSFATKSVRMNESLTRMN